MAPYGIHTCATLGSWHEANSLCGAHIRLVAMVANLAALSFAAAGLLQLCQKLLSTVDSTGFNRVGNDRGTQ